jgi:hypothetical protein
MLIRAALFLSLALPVFAGEGGVSYQIAGKSYALSGAQAALVKRHGKLQLVIGVKDQAARSQLAITAELDANSLDAPVDLNSDFSAVSAVIVNTQGIYSVAPHVTLARDEFMRYTKKEEIETNETEADPDDRSFEDRKECGNGMTDACLRAKHAHGRRRKKVRVRYVQHGPTWVGKSRQQRIDTGDGIMREEKYRDTSFMVRLTPVHVNGKLVRLDGTFAGVLIYNEGMKPGTRIPLQNGQFSVRVENQ